MQLFKRIIIGGLNGFYRNRTISVSSIFILIITLSIICSILLFKAVFTNSVSQIKSKVDISIYLKKEVTDTSIISIKQKLKNLSEVKEVNFISKEEVLDNFKEKYKNDPSTDKALQEINTNPFGPVFQIIAKDTNDYSKIIAKINEQNLLGEESKDIEKINYFDLKDSIEKLNNLIAWFDSFGFVMTFIFIIISLMIVYNTTRLAIFTFKDEISIMKLVGASDMYIRGPFIVESILYGFISSIITLSIFYPITKYIGTKTIVFLGGYNINTYFVENIPTIFIILLMSGILVSITSSIFAVRKYLMV